jgi:hypothetical protein
MTVNFTAAAVVDRFAAVHLADVALDSAYLAADAAFRESALFTYSATSNGVSADSIAAEAKRRAAEAKIKDRNYYTAGSAVGFHAVTGMALALPGDLPVFKSRIGDVQAGPRDLQAIVKVVGQTAAKRIIGDSATLGDAFSALLAAKVEKESTPAPVKVTTVADLLAAMNNILTGAVDRTDWTAEDKAAAKAMASTLTRVSLPVQGKPSAPVSIAA